MQKKCVHYEPSTPRNSTGAVGLLTVITSALDRTAERTEEAQAISGANRKW